ncbi:hypothetical protein B0H11DRAFT_203418 [Mycena galericulata]|nr:hypothetical protein B0H11DRAFT_203418 [Mycena galericulata]
MQPHAFHSPRKSARQSFSKDGISSSCGLCTDARPAFAMALFHTTQLYGAHPLLASLTMGIRRYLLRRTLRYSSSDVTTPPPGAHDKSHSMGPCPLRDSRQNYLVPQGVGGAPWSCSISGPFVCLRCRAGERGRRVYWDSGARGWGGRGRRHDHPRPASANAPAPKSRFPCPQPFIREPGGFPYCSALYPPELCAQGVAGAQRRTRLIKTQAMQQLDGPRRPPALLYLEILTPGGCLAVSRSSRCRRATQVRPDVRHSRVPQAFAGWLGESGLGRMASTEWASVPAVLPRTFLLGARRVRVPHPPSRIGFSRRRRRATRRPGANHHRKVTSCIPESLILSTSYWTISSSAPTRRRGNGWIEWRPCHRSPLICVILSKTDVFSVVSLEGGIIARNIASIVHYCTIFPHNTLGRSRPVPSGSGAHKVAYAHALRQRSSAALERDHQNLHPHHPLTPKRPVLHSFTGPSLSG